MELGSFELRDRQLLVSAERRTRSTTREPAEAILTVDPDDVREGLDRLLPRLWRFCLVLTRERSAADDLAQAVCVRALERADQYQRGTRFDRWIFRVAQTVWLNQLRSNRIRHGRGLVPAEEAALVDDAADVEANFYAAEVFARIMALPEALRVAVLLVYVEGYSYKEAAEHLEIPIGTVMSRLASARSHLAALRDGASEEGAAKAGQR
jgi:RNA polymerase sigma-70 factor (ECF subfamily)